MLIGEPGFSRKIGGGLDEGWKEGMGEGRTDRQMIEWIKRTNKRMAEKMNKSKVIKN